MIPKRWPRCSALLLALLVACEGGEVQNDGWYSYLPGAPVADTNALPLRHLLLIEQDAVSEQTLFYYFTGDLGDADLGLMDLRRIALNYGEFRLRFEFPLDQYTRVPQSAAGGEGGSAGAVGSGGGALGFASASRARALELDVEGRVVVLWPLDDSELVRVGASRFVSSVTSSQWSVQAYFGAFDSALLEGRVVLHTADGPLSYLADLKASKRFEVSRANVLSVAHEPASRVDTVELDLLQTLVRLQDDLEINSILRVSSEPTTTVDYEGELLQQAFSNDCWSLEHDLMLRVIQTVRSYVPRQGRDFAVEHKRFDAQRIPEEYWHDFVAGTASAAYCSRYQ